MSERYSVAVTGPGVDVTLVLESVEDLAVILMVLKKIEHVLEQEKP